MIRADFLANLIFACLISSLSIPLFASSASAVPIKAEAVYVAGKASYVAAKDAVTRDVEVGAVFAEGDKITTGADGRVHIKIESGGMILIDNNTEFGVGSLRYGDNGAINTSFGLLVGRIKSSLSKIAAKDSMEYRTKAALVGIAGTPEHILEVKPADGGKSLTNVYALAGKDGSLRVQGFDPANTFVMLTAGMGTSVIEGLAPLAPFLLTPAILKGFKHLTAKGGVLGDGATGTAGNGGMDAADALLAVGGITLGTVAIVAGVSGVSGIANSSPTTSCTGWSSYGKCGSIRACTRSDGSGNCTAWYEFTNGGQYTCASCGNCNAAAQQAANYCF